MPLAKMKWWQSIYIHIAFIQTFISFFIHCQHLWTNISCDRHCIMFIFNCYAFSTTIHYRYSYVIDNLKDNNTKLIRCSMPLTNNSSNIYELQYQLVTGYLHVCKTIPFQTSIQANFNQFMTKHDTLIIKTNLSQCGIMNYPRYLQIGVKIFNIFYL